MTESDDQLAEGVRSSLRTQASQISIADEPFDPNRAPLQPLDGVGVSSAGSRRRRALVAVAAGVVFLLIGAGVLLARGGGDDQAVETVSPPDVDQPEVTPPTSETAPDSTTTTALASVETTPPTDEVPVEVPTTEPPLGDLSNDIVLPPDPTVSWARIELDTTTLSSGGWFEGRITYFNASGAPIYGPDCTVPFSVRLESDAMPPAEDGSVLPETPYPPPVTCASVFPTVPVGESVWPVQVGAHYRGCTNGDPPPSDWSPECLPGVPDLMPPLPPGRYWVAVRVPVGLGIVAPAPIEVTVT